MYDSFNKLMKNTDYLNKRYGNHFGLKVLIIGLTIGTIYCLALMGFMELRKMKDSGKSYVLDSEKKCIIYTLPRSGPVFYYEVDYEKNKVVKRYDIKYKREELRKLSLEDDYLEKLTNEIISNEDNMTFSDEEKLELYKKGIYTFYMIKTYDNKNVYVKSQDKIEELERLLQIE